MLINDQSNESSSSSGLRRQIPADKYDTSDSSSSLHPPKTYPIDVLADAGGGVGGGVVGTCRDNICIQRNHIKCNVGSGIT